VSRFVGLWTIFLAPKRPALRYVEVHPLVWLHVVGNPDRTDYNRWKRWTEKLWVDHIRLTDESGCSVGGPGEGLIWNHESSHLEDIN
jgi:hypothetical protein